MKVVFVAMRRNVAELPDLAALAADLGVDELWVQNLSHSFSDTEPAGQYAGIREYAAEESLETDLGAFRDSFTAAAAVAAERGLLVLLPRLDERPAPTDPGRPGCTWRWHSAYVTHRGEVQPCCMVMGSDRATLGRLDGQSFADIWHSEPYQAFREGLIDHEPAEVCCGCAMYQGTF